MEWTADDTNSFSKIHTRLPKGHDLCYDRTSVGKKPMCATVCPSQALSYVRPEEIAKRREKPTNVFLFGKQKIVTCVHMMVPADTNAVTLDVLNYMWEESYVAFAQPQ